MVEVSNRMDAMGYQVEKFLTEAKEQEEKNPEAALKDDDRKKLE